MSDAHKGQTGGWEPIPQSEGYDGDATAFVQLPPDFMLDGVPLEAPGHGYVPPMITPLQPLAPAPAPDPAATGAWTVHVPTEAQQTQYFTGGEFGEGTFQEGPFGEGAPQGGSFGEGSLHEGPFGEGSPQAGSFGDGSLQGGSFGDGSLQGGSFGDGSLQGGSFGDGTFQGGEHFQPPAYVENVVEHLDRAEQDPHATAEWRFEGAVAPAADPGATGQWQIPVAPDEAVAGVTPASYAEAPATLPGGAPAPWALPEEPAAVPEEPGQTGEASGGGAEAAAREAVREPAPEDVPDVEQTVAPEAAPDLEPAVAPAVVPDPEPAVAPDGEAAEAAAPEEAAPAPVPAPAVDASTDSDEHPHTSYTLRVNGTDRPVTGSWIGESLLYVLRERLGLAGAKDGCSQGECGACNVQVDGRLVASCLVPAATAAGSEVRTVEGLATDGEPSDVQRAMARCGTVQCGFCIPGMCMTVHDLLEGNHAPTELETRQALAGNLCRCSGYRGVLDAVRDVVAEREAAAQAGAPETAGEPRVPHQIPHPHDGGMA
ncbi:2Fe-2S iron-sulfur cluster-binding protein [Streptomyces sp. NPDC059695]|uniref:(2Fe-2S)-binding protein n=1 Tax=Streptomyces sp. NPDC059695 TaxID=3346910 RepID=UPI00368E1CB8